MMPLPVWCQVLSKGIMPLPVWSYVPPGGSGPMFFWRMSGPREGMVLPPPLE